MAFAPSTKPVVFQFYSDEMVSFQDVPPERQGGEYQLPSTEDLNSRLKVYRSGGENKMHHHPNEDHAFFVLAGKVVFHIERDDNTVEVSPHEAVLLPKGSRYWFTSVGEGNLVMLRIGTSLTAATNRLQADGTSMRVVPDSFRPVEGRVLV